ncbi:16559_t:CDS:2, partial [Cetraspora pellucida]
SFKKSSSLPPFIEDSTGTTLKVDKKWHTILGEEIPLIEPQYYAKLCKIISPPKLSSNEIHRSESEPGKIIENYLFQDPFHMIVTIRIGTNSPGKSTILNQLMKRNFMFSSPNEPGAEYRMPHMISGSIEFTWLTEKTCGVGLWTEVLRNFYKEKKNKIVLLANLHGDALNYPDQVKFLRQFTSSFLVFLMPGYDDNQKNNLNELTGNKKSVYCWINQKNKPKYSFDTTLLTNDQNLKKIRIMINEALELDTSNKALDLNDSTFDISKLKLEGTLRFTEEIEFLKSQHLIDFIQEKNCRHIKLEVMQLQQTPKDGFSIIQNNRELKDLISLFVNTLMLPLDKRRRALAHIKREISKLSSKESSNAREKAISKRDELCKISVGNKANEKKVKNEIAKIWEEINNISLGLEHFFCELGQFYKFTSVYDRMADIMKLPELCAELLISGDAIELLDGDAGTIPETWFLAICKHVDKLYPKLKIFVISILGLQSSGKSTLLNALFACRFAVSVGRCTRGLFMRLLFLEEDLAQEIGVDAFVLIDTEGLGVSNLTILNVLGEAMRDLTEILQIVIVTMARLEKANMAPDILMVQHVSERNIAKLTKPEEKFQNAVQEALKITDKQDTRMGISSMKCLQTLEERIKDGKLLKLFQPFKDGATAHAPPSGQYHDDIVNLYKSILVDSFRDNVIPVTQQIDEEVGNEFRKTSSFFINKYKKETRPDLSKRVAYKKYLTQYYLDVKDVSVLKNILDSLTDKILEKRKSPLFYDGIVRDLRKEIYNTLDKFSKKLEISLITEFKWDVYLNALKVFKQTMTNHQNKWNIENIKAIHKKAMKVANRKKIDSVKNVGWMNDPETVRLKYFRMLAEQVYYSNKEKAISHFRYPRSIESWFEAEVNSIKSNPEPEYNKTYESEFDLVRQEIHYEVDLRNLKDNDNKLCAYIEDRLNNYNRPIPERFMDASDDESIMKMLGCTETCYWCDALCWGSRGHHEHKDETRKHYTSHQPTGLGGTRRKNVDMLVAEQCHQWTERKDQEVWYHLRKEDLKEVDSEENLKEDDLEEERGPKRRGIGRVPNRGSRRANWTA